MKLKILKNVVLHSKPDNPFDKHDEVDVWKLHAGVAKLVDAPDLGSGEYPSWEFESLRPHCKGQ